MSIDPGGHDVMRSLAFTHIVREPDGTSIGVWGNYTLRSAFQPIFAIRDGKASIAAFEGLARPFRNGEALPPSGFFRIIPAADRMALETLTRTLHLLNAGAFLDQDCLIFVNFDPSVFSDPAVVETVLRDMRLVLHEAGIDPARVVCELTEQSTASDATLHGFVHALRMHGLKIAVDDYGSHDSDAERVRSLRPDIVKFDAQWITRLMESGPGFALLSSMVTSFSDRGIETVFEGIEETWQLELAERCGVSLVQGYALARPELAPASFDHFRAVRSGGSPDGEVIRHKAADGHVRRPAAARRVFGRRMAKP